MEGFFHVQLSDCGTSLPPQDAIGDPQKPWLFGESLKWAVFARIRGQGTMEGFFHVQLVRQRGERGLTRPANR